MQFADQEFWQGRWQTGATGWDLGKPHPHTARMIDLIAKFHPAATGPVFIPGCGRAHDAAVFCARGFTVVACDFAEDAIAEAKKAYGHIKALTLKCQDATLLSPNEIAAYDVIFDRAMYCALRPDLRDAYIKSCFDRLKPGGIFASLPFTKIQFTAERPEGSGPPFCVSREEMTTRLHAMFELKHWEPRTDGSCDGRILEETISIWTRK